MSRYLPIAARILLGLVFTLFSLNYFVPFIPTPSVPEAYRPVMFALMATHYLPTVKTIEFTAGLALLGNRFVPLALALLTPIEIAILLFHGSIDGVKAVGMPLALLGLTAYLAWSYRGAYAPMLRARTKTG